MHLSIETSLFCDAISKILSVVDKKNSRPILSFILLEANKENLSLSATDLEVSAKIIIPAKIDVPGKFCINAKNIHDILRELPNDIVTLKSNENEKNLIIECKKIHYSLLINSTNDYPPLSLESNKPSFNLSSSVINEAINKTSYAISSDETRLYLNGIFLQEVESKLRFVATDGHRLSIFDTELSISLDTLKNGIIVPRKGINEIKKMADSNLLGSLKFSIDDSFIYVSMNEKNFLSIRMIAREYPKYQTVIPSKTNYSLSVEKMLFQDAVRRIKIMSNEKSNGLKIHVTDKEMTILANHPSLGDAEEKVPVKFNGQEIEIGFNAKYLLDVLNSFDTSDINLEINNELSPVVIKSSAIPNYVGIIMPLKL